jgi:hypothetical protein
VNSSKRLVPHRRPPPALGECRLASRVSRLIEGDCPLTDTAEKRGQLIRHLEDALALADEIEDGQTGFLIERALDEARSRQFRLAG